MTFGSFVYLFAFVAVGTGQLWNLYFRIYTFHFKIRLNISHGITSAYVRPSFNVNKNQDKASESAKQTTDGQESMDLRINTKEEQSFLEINLYMSSICTNRLSVSV